MTTKLCKNCRIDFKITQDDLSFYEKIGVPSPTLCPDCRYQRRLANRNEWNFYKRNCSLCGKGMVSLYNPEYPGPVYCHMCYWSDNWDALDYGRDLDFNRPFFEQFKEHRFTVPRITLANESSVNSEYTNQANNNRNCYMIVAANECEFCMYGNWNQNSKECVDCWNVKECELIYESLDCLKCYHSAWLETCVDSSHCYFGNDLRGCNDCFGCVGLRQKSYCWFNEQLTKDEYQKRLEAFDWSHEAIGSSRKKLQELRLKIPVEYYHGSQILNCTGDYIGFSKNMKNCFNCFKNENLKYSQDAWEAKDCMDLTETLDNTMDYEVEGTGWGQRNVSTSKKWYGSDVYYSELTFHADNLFGCVSMIKKNYCIFNKQYSPEDWKAVKEKIVEHMKKTGEWGEFFPATISPFPYNDTVALDYFPMTKDEVLAKGWRWYDKPHKEYTIGGDVFRCTSTTGDEGSGCAGVGAFRLHPMEIEFYKKMSSGGGSASGGKLPTPELCFPCRLRARLARRNPRKLWSRECMKCSAPIETSYAPDRPEIVYCEECYNKEVA